MPVHVTLQMDFLSGIGLKQDEICNMASISVVLLGLNPETRLRPVVAYLEKRGVSGERLSSLYEALSEPMTALRDAHRTDPPDRLPWSMP